MTRSRYIPDATAPVGVRVLEEVDVAAVARFLATYGLTLEVVETATIPGSFWGDREAGLRRRTLFARSDTPLHSILHETCHFICMDATRRGEVDTDAGGDDLEECAVCYLQILLAEHIPDYGRDRMLADMDRWGYSFRLGSARRWFAADAADAREWLARRGLIPAAPAHSPRTKTCYTAEDLDRGKPKVR